MTDKKIGMYSFVTPESEAEKKVEEKKHPKDRLLSVERQQKYEITLQDMFAMRLNYMNESTEALKNAIMSLRDYKAALTQVLTWEEQIAKAMADQPILKEGNELTEDQLHSEEESKQFMEIAATLEEAFNKLGVKRLVPEEGAQDEAEVLEGEENLEAKK